MLNDISLMVIRVDQKTTAVITLSNVIKALEETAEVARLSVLEKKLSENKAQAAALDDARNILDRVGITEHSARLSSSRSAAERLSLLLETEVQALRQRNARVLNAIEALKAIIREP